MREREQEELCLTVNDGTGYDEIEEKSNVETESLEGVISDREVRHLNEKMTFEYGFKEMRGCTTWVFDEEHSWKRA